MSSKYPTAIDPVRVGLYSALTFSGGGDCWDDVLEYRVWLHRREGGDDTYEAFPTYEDACEFRDRAKRGGEYAIVEEPLVLVSQGDRLTEWRPEWLEQAPRTKEGKR